MLKTSLAVLGLAIAAAAAPAGAVNLVVNGGFEITTSGIGQFDNNTIATGWSSGGYNFLFHGTTADSEGSSGQYGYLALWGPANGAANGLGPSPDGGNFAAADGAFGVAPIQQTISGLTAGQSYVVKFSWAGAQQLGFNGTNTEQWEVSLGGPSQFTGVYVNPSHGFSGWTSEAFTFTAAGTSAVLSFLAHGTPDGVPPFSLLDGVSLEAAGGVPEASTWVMLIAGFGLVGAAARRRRTATVAA